MNYSLNSDIYGNESDCVSIEVTAMMLQHLMIQIQVG